MKAQIVSFHCVLKDQMGNVLSSTFNRDVITQAEGSGSFLKGFADGLNDLKKGEKRKICLSANQAYGFYDPDLVLEISKKSFSEGNSLSIGQEVQTQSKKGVTKLFRVTRVDGDLLTLDANHPYAGHDLTFLIETTDVRDATSEEVLDSGMKSPSRYLH